MRLDLPYEEDSRAEVDMNVVATDAGTLVEVQGTAEGATFSRATLDRLLDLAQAGTAQLCAAQQEAPPANTRFAARTVVLKPTDMSRLLLASRNAKKPRRIAPLSWRRRRVDRRRGRRTFDDVPPFPEEPETGATFEENAPIKGARRGPFH